MGRILIGLIAILSLGALVLHFGIVLTRNAELGTIAAIVDFFSFFTILSNSFVLLVAWSTALGRGNMLGRPAAQGAAASYIFVVMAIYHVVLRSQWDPQGWVRFDTTLLHYAVPTLYLCWWGSSADKSTLTHDLPMKWLAFPVAFLVVSLVRGAFTGWYPYSFLDVSEIGYAIALRNAALIAMLFLIIGHGLVLLGRIMLRGQRPA
jgi:hypothetical protein